MAEIRPMQIDDDRAVLDLWNATEGLILTDADSESGVAKYLERNPGLSLVAIDDGKIIGAVLCGHDGRRGLLHHLAVSTGHRRKGIGTALVDACCRQLEAAGMTRCNLYVIADNRAGAEFWLHRGFWERPDLRLMSRDLTAG